jgi:hypothetical protein
MNKNNVDRLVKLRKFLINYYETLDGGQNPSSAVAMQRDIAAILESSIRSVDEILSDYVSFT